MRGVTSADQWTVPTAPSEVTDGTVVEMLLVLCLEARGVSVFATRIVAQFGTATL